MDVATTKKIEWVAGNPHDRSVEGFCIRHGSARGPMSRSAYHKLQNSGRGPRETHLGPKTIIITADDERAWEKARANPEGTEARLIHKLKAMRRSRAKKAVAVALAGDNHVSKQRRSTRNRET